ncbi:MAG: PilN domain-containing protein [Gammaproteobacteria bacterium]|jgi:type IV pilus assembly protein PilN|nr:PilN domain-containing protein [Gammaproteobacteria bacterium]
MTININLLPWREELKIQQKKEFISLLGLAILAATGLILFIHMLISRQIAFQNENNDFLKNEIKKLDQQIAEIQALQKEKQQLLARMEIIQQLQTNRPQIVRMFDGIVHTVPEGLYLTNLSRTGPNVVLDGKAESNTRVSTFMRNIESSSWLKNPLLTLIQADSKEEKQGEKNSDRMIGFNLQAIETVDAQANLNKLLKEDKAQDQVDTKTPKNTTK